MHRYLLVIFAVFVATAVARAQSSSNNIVYAPGSASSCTTCQPFIPSSGTFSSSPDSVVTFIPTPGGGALGSSMPLSAFASEQDLTQAYQTLSSQISQNTQALNNLNQSVRRVQNRASQGVAAVSSITVVPPNPGDRFSVTFGGGEYDSEGGGGISFAYRPPEWQNTLVFAGYARTADTNLVKGGLSLSFH
jgi:hypothetical protein